MNIGQSLCFDDVLMEPLLSKISTRSSINLETNIATNGRSLIIKTPLISSPMDTVTETDMAIKMALNGGLGIIHRFMDMDEQVSQITKVKRFLQYIIQEPYKIVPTTTLEEIEELRNSYNVSSFCVVENINTNKLLGILTKRDIEYMKQKQYDIVNSIQTSIQTTNYCDGINGINYNDSINDNNDIILQAYDFMSKSIITLDVSMTIHSLEDTLSIAKEIMLERKIEKIPIVNNGILVGLITLNNIKHYENNKSKACIDTNGSLCVGAAIGIVDDYMERLDKLISVGVDLICIDVANGFNENVFKSITLIREKYKEIVLMVGNVCNWQGYQALCNYDVDCIRIGVGNGSICTTRLETGIGKGQFSAVSECFRYKVEYNTQPHIICDGGSLGKTGNKVKALACGSSAIMLGRTLASTEESPGTIIYRNGKRFKYIRGMASTMANISKQEKTETKINQTNKSNTNTQSKLKTKFTAEGVDGEQELTGSVVDVIEQINGGLKSGMSYLGCENINQLHDKSCKGEIKFNLVTSIGMSETGIRVKTY
jgi:IMP dehydrogenase